MNSREAFEWWMSDEGKSPKAVERNGECYKLMQAQICWSAWQPAWQAATLAEREACAKVCEEVGSEYDDQEVYASWCAKAIRARSEKGEG